MITETELYGRYEELRKENTRLQDDLRQLYMDIDRIVKENNKLKEENWRHKEEETEKKVIPFEWERIYFNYDGHDKTHTWRAKVIGGWLVSSESQNNDMYRSESMVFVSDPNHSWEV